MSDFLKEKICVFGKTTSFIGNTRFPLIFYTFGMETPWWWKRPRASKSKTYSAERSFVGRPLVSQASESENRVLEVEEKTSVDEFEERCVRCGAVAISPNGAFCSDCEEHDRVVHPRRVAQLYPQYFKTFTCGKCQRCFVGFVMCSPCEGCPYTDCFHEASSALRRVVGRRMRSVKQVRLSNCQYL